MRGAFLQVRLFCRGALFFGVRMFATWRRMHMMASVKSTKAALVPLLFATLIATALSLTGCGTENNIAHKSDPKDDTITSVEEMPERLTEAMNGVSGCRMTIE